jgi:hypothetical protein
VVVLLKPQQLLLQETLIDKYIGFDIDSKKTVACIVQKGERDRYGYAGVLEVSEQIRP